MSIVTLTYIVLTLILYKCFTKKKQNRQLNTPAYVILSSNNEASTLNFISYLFVGNSIANDPTTFRKIGKFSKISSNNISNGITDNKFLIEKINNLYTSENYVNQDTYQYGSTRQHNFSSLNSFLPDFTSLVNNSSFKTFIDYSINSKANKTINSVHANLFTKSLNAFNKELVLLARIN